MIGQNERQNFYTNVTKNTLYLCTVYFVYDLLIFYDRSHKGGRIHIHAFWFDIYTGDILIFSRNESTFVVVNDETLPKLEVSLILYSSIFYNCGYF